MNGRELSLAVVGAAHLNADGSNRRFFIRAAAPGDPIELRADPGNAFDPAAIAVLTARGEQIGFIAADRCVWIGAQLRSHGGSAIFQEETLLGAIIRVRIGDGAPSLPAKREPQTVRDDWDAVDPDGPEFGA